MATKEQNLESLNNAVSTLNQIATNPSTPRNIRKNITDLIDGLINISKLIRDFTGPINLGRNEEISMLELAKKIIKLTNSKSSIEFHNLPENDPHQRNPDLDLAKKNINWSPSVNLENGLKKTINYFEELI